MSQIPKILHYCFGLSSNFGHKPWSLIHYVCVKSAIEKIKPDNVFFYYEYEPAGPWWELTKPLVELVKIVAPREIFGNPINKVAHRADVVRLEKLMQHGGIYLDCDVFVLRDFDNLLGNSFVISEEGVGAAHGLSNAVMLSEPGAPFLKHWYAEYRSFRGDQFWAEHSIELPLKLSRLFPQELAILPYSAFVWPLYYEEHLRWIFERDQPPIDGESYTRHLWESIAWEKYLENLTPRRVREAKSHFSGWVSPLISNLPDDFAAPSFLNRSHKKIFHKLKGLRRFLKK
jgi:glycosyl transferase-like sugar-binding protein